MFSETEDYLNVTKIIFEKKKKTNQESDESATIPIQQQKNSDNNLTTTTTNNNNKFVLDAGEYIYPFSVDLPKNIPETFEHSYGIINYSISAYLEIPM